MASPGVRHGRGRPLQLAAAWAFFYFKSVPHTYLGKQRPAFSSAHETITARPSGAAPTLSLKAKSFFSPVSPHPQTPGLLCCGHPGGWRQGQGAREQRGRGGRPHLDSLPLGLGLEHVAFLR